MIKAEVVFEDDYIVCNGKHIWFYAESGHFAVGVADENNDDGGEIEELFASQEQAVQYCLEQGHD